MARSALDRASRLASLGRYGELVALLEPQLPLFRDSERYYYLLGSACLHTGDIGGAFTYLKRAEQLEPGDIATTLCLAALYVRRSESQKAIEYYLHVLEVDPKEAHARRGLSLLRKKDFEQELPSLIESGALKRLYPSDRRLWRLIAPIAIVAALCIAGYLLFPLATEAFEGLRESRSARPEVAAVSLSADERRSAVETGGSYRYILTEREALASFEKAKAYFEAYRDNAAVVELNRLLSSNASAAVKEKAKTLKSFVGTPDFRSVRDVPDYASVSRDPTLYEGCAILWRGTAANIDEAGGFTTFHFLVGYVDGKRLEGIVPVSISGEKTQIPAGSPFELLGRVRVDGGSLSIDAIAVHTLRSD
jgi:tetratricopeptide (TPR) repeat protein